MKSEKGAAMLEMAVVIPFFVVLFLGLVDVGMTIKKNQYLSVVVREVANNAYRECKDATTGTATQNCLQKSLNDSVSFNTSTGTLAGLQMTVKAWDVRGSGGFTLVPVLKGQSTLGDAFTSKFGVGTVANMKSYDPKLRKTLITVEAQLDNTKSPFLSFARVLSDSAIF